MAPSGYRDFIRPILRSDSRAALRSFFEIDKRYVALAALRSLVDEGEVALETLKQAIEHLDISAAKPSPLDF